MHIIGLTELYLVQVTSNSVNCIPSVLSAFKQGLAIILLRWSQLPINLELTHG